MCCCTLLSGAHPSFLLVLKCHLCLFSPPWVLRRSRRESCLGHGEASQRVVLHALGGVCGEVLLADGHEPLQPLGINKTRTTL